MTTHALATAGPCLARCLADAGASRGRRSRSDAPGFGARGTLERPARGAFRRFAPSRGTPTTVAHAANGSGRSEHDEDAARARDAAAASGRLAPLDVKTLVGAELELIMKADPLAFERALADQVRPRDPVRAPVFLDTPAKTSFRSRPVHDGLSLETLAFRDAKVLFVFKDKKECSSKVPPRRAPPRLTRLTSLDHSRAGDARRHV